MCLWMVFFVLFLDLVLIVYSWDMLEFLKFLD